MIVRKRNCSWNTLLIAVFVLLLQLDADAADKFKPFKLKTPDGQPNTLADFSNKATLVGFFFPSCRYCTAAAPHMQELYDKYKDQGLSMVRINIVPGEDKKIPAWQEKHQFTVPDTSNVASTHKEIWSAAATPPLWLSVLAWERTLPASSVPTGDRNPI